MLGTPAVVPSRAALRVLQRLAWAGSFGTALFVEYQRQTLASRSRTIRENARKIHSSAHYSGPATIQSNEDGSYSIQTYDKSVRRLQSDMELEKLGDAQKDQKISDINIVHKDKLLLQHTVYAVPATTRRLKVEDLISSRDLKTYTVDKVQHLSDLGPGSELFMVQWKKELRKLAKADQFARFAALHRTFQQCEDEEVCALMCATLLAQNRVEDGIDHLRKASLSKTATERCVAAFLCELWRAKHDRELFMNAYAKLLPLVETHGNIARHMALYSTLVAKDVLIACGIFGTLGENGHTYMSEGTADITRPAPDHVKQRSLLFHKLLAESASSQSAEQIEQLFHAASFCLQTVPQKAAALVVLQSYLDQEKCDEACRFLFYARTIYNIDMHGPVATKVLKMHRKRRGIVRTRALVGPASRPAFPCPKPSDLAQDKPYMVMGQMHAAYHLHKHLDVLAHYENLKQFRPHWLPSGHTMQLVFRSADRMDAITAGQEMYDAKYGISKTTSTSAAIKAEATHYWTDYAAKAIEVGSTNAPKWSNVSLDQLKVMLSSGLWSKAPRRHQITREVSLLLTEKRYDEAQEVLRNIPYAEWSTVEYTLEIEGQLRQNRLIRVKHLLSEMLDRDLVIDKRLRRKLAPYIQNVSHFRDECEKILSIHKERNAKYAQMWSMLAHPGPGTQAEPQASTASAVAEEKEVEGALPSDPAFFDEAVADMGYEASMSPDLRTITVSPSLWRDTAKASTRTEGQFSDRANKSDLEAAQCVDQEEVVSASVAEMSAAPAAGREAVAGQQLSEWEDTSDLETTLREEEEEEEIVRVSALAVPPRPARRSQLWKIPTSVTREEDHGFWQSKPTRVKGPLKPSAAAALLDVAPNFDSGHVPTSSLPRESYSSLSA